MLTEKQKQDFKADLRSGRVRFIYLKADLSKRVAKGTLNLDYIPADKQPAGKGKPNESQLRYWDIDKDGWRAAKWEDILWVEGMGCVNEGYKDDLDLLTKACLITKSNGDGDDIC